MIAIWVTIPLDIPMREFLKIVVALLSTEIKIVGVPAMVPGT
jgi:hypothetical protein